MNRILRAAAIVVLALVPASAIAHQGMHMKHDSSDTKSKTITGEIVDTGCYLSSAERGPKHVTCASKCIARGMPMGLVTKDDKIYLLTLNHDNGDPYNRLKRMAGKTVTVTGPVASHDGMKAIDVMAVHAGSH